MSGFGMKNGNGNGGYQQRPAMNQNNNYSNQNSGNQNANKNGQKKYENITGLWTPKETMEGSTLVASGICKDDGYTYKVFINKGYEEGSKKPQYNLVRCVTPPRA